MAFKTNSIRLKEYSDSGGDPGSYDGTAANGDIAIVGSTLKLRAGGNWTSIAGAGGATQLSGLTDVSDSPASAALKDLAMVVDDGGTKRMQFQKLAIDSIDSGAIIKNADSWAPSSDTTVATTQSIENRLTALGTGTNFNHVQNTALGGSDLTVTAGTKYNNLTYVNTAAQGSDKFLFNGASTWGAYCVITIINVSSADLILGKVTGGSAVAFKFNCPQLHDPPLQDQITLNPHQKAILVKTSGNNWDTIVASV